jgi:ABC-2 type transport system ATP-binding protein
MNGVIEAKELYLDYGKNVAIYSMNINLNENQLIGLVGKNGSGKTTFMKLCAGLLYPTQGEINIHGHNPMNNLEVLKEIVYSYPNIAFQESNTLNTIIDYYAMFYPRFDTTFAKKLLTLFSLKLTQKYKSLSQGMTSTFNYICALSTRAKLTLLDEPVLGMDITVRKKVYEILLRDYMEYPRTILISSHILSEIEDILSQIILIDTGKIVFYKDIDEVSAMAYRIDGAEAAVKAYTHSIPVLLEVHNTTGSSAIIESRCDDAVIKKCQSMNLKVARLRPEEIYIYKTNQDGRMEIECLWTN